MSDQARKFDLAGLNAKLARGEMLTRAEMVDLCDEFESLTHFVEEIKAGLYSGCDKISDRLKEYEVEF